MLSLHLFTSHDYVYVADVECQVMFSLVTLYCFMCNITLVTFLGLQYWSASTTYHLWAQKNLHFLCVEPRETDKSVLKLSWNFLKIWSWNFTSCCWERALLLHSRPFLARDSIYAIARYMPSPVRPSVCPSHGWISQRQLKLGSCNLHHRVAPWL